MNQKGKTITAVKGRQGDKRTEAREDSDGEERKNKQRQVLKEEKRERE